MNSELPLVSVVLCFYNEERFIAEAIESVLRQQYRHWELILVDDGSTDRSVGIAKGYVDRFPDRIFYFDHNGHVNKGLSASRNRGVDASTGHLITFLDADDVFLPNKLESQVMLFGQIPEATVLFEGSTYWYSWDQRVRKDRVVPVGLVQNRLFEPPELMKHVYPLGKGAGPCICGMLARRSVFQRSRFHEAFRGMYEDQAFLSQVYLREKVYVSSTANNLYRQRDDSLCSTAHARGEYDQVRRYYLNWFEGFLAQEKTADEEIWKLLRTALIKYRSPLRYKLTVTWRNQAHLAAYRLFRRLFGN
jgi:glycosyltransferase involved in cell wall biosynthesis